MKTVLYYTSTYFMDISLELINVLKKHVNLHVLIEITASSKNANIVNIDALPLGKNLVAPQDILSQKDYARVAPFLEGAASVYFVVHRHPTGLSFNTIQVIGEVKKHIKKCRPDILHFETYSLRTLGLATLFFKKRKLLITVHDAVLHSGEFAWKTVFPRTLFFRLPVKKTFLFYSAHSLDQFVKFTKHSKSHKVLLQMYPFSYFNKIATHIEEAGDHLLFFGRISKYKGVKYLLDAMPAVIEAFPDEKLIIAGKGADEEILQHPVLQNGKYHTTIIDRYIPNDELVQLIKKARFVICPYTDATQSGVLMTAFALYKPAVASNVGAFSEQIENGKNGFLAAASNPEDLAKKINECLLSNRYLQMSESLKADGRTNAWEKNWPLLENAYQENNIHK